jgi:hypothetical protein
MGVKELSGLSMTNIFMLPTTLTKFLSWMIRKNTANLKEIADYFEQTEDVVQPLIMDLINKGYILEDKTTGTFSVNLGS